MDSLLVRQRERLTDFMILLIVSTLFLGAEVGTVAVDGPEVLILLGLLPITVLWFKMGSVFSELWRME